MVASNQPFYPFYIYFLVGNDGGVSFLTLLSTPFFLLIPHLSRNWPNASLASIPVLGLANGMLAMKALGIEAGIELFVLPCVLVALLVPDRQSSRIVLPAAASTVVLFWIQFVYQAVALHTFSAQEFVSLYRLNAFSVAGLTIYILYALGRARLDHNRIRT